MADYTIYSYVNKSQLCNRPIADLIEIHENH